MIFKLIIITYMHDSLAQVFNSSGYEINHAPKLY